MTSLPYIFLNHETGRTHEAVRMAQELESRGFPGVFSSGTPGDNMALSLLLLERTRTLAIGTGIAGIYHRHAHTMATAACMFEELHPGRFTLGLGVTHAPWLREMGLPYGKPLSDMRRYVQEIRSILNGQPGPPVLVAALRTRMTALAGEVGDGVIWANAALSHTGYSMSALPQRRPPGFIVANSAPVCVHEDRDVAAAAIRRYLLFYMKLEHYRNYWIEAGYRQEVEAAEEAINRNDDAAAMAAMSERFVADVGLSGTVDDIRQGMARWADAGISHLILDPVSVATTNLLDATGEVLALAE